MPIAERLIPNADFGNFTAKTRESLAQSRMLSRTEADIFLQQENAVLISVIALYPRYYQQDSRIYLADLPDNYTFLQFLLIGDGSNQIVLPLQNVPSGIPNTSTVTIIGCQAEGYISAWAVIVHSIPEQILMRDPYSRLSCPLTEPN